MYLEKLTIVNFRNYEKAEIKFNSGINLILGLNAQGKTNLLEAIYLLCLGRSFRLAKNQELLQSESQFFTLEGFVNFDNNINKVVIIHYIRDGKKEIAIDRKRLRNNSELFGNFPIVTMTPDDYKITTGGPSERRRFIDILLSQVSIFYLKDLQEYNRILKQRNKILQNNRDGFRLNEAAIEPWTQKLVKVGGKIINERVEFLKDFLKILNPLYREFTELKDILNISLDSSVPLNNRKSLEENFYVALNETKEKERFVGMTLLGPHRDDIFFEINGKELRKYGSRGEHKSVLISLKLAEYKFLKNKKDETPIFLLDDFHSELDEMREEKVFKLLQGVNQIFLTSPKQKVFNHYKNNSNSVNEVSKFYVADGNIELYKI